MGQGKQSMQEWEGISRPCPGLKGQAPASGVKSGLSGRVTPGGPVVRAQGQPYLAKVSACKQCRLFVRQK